MAKCFMYCLVLKVTSLITGLYVYCYSYKMSSNYALSLCMASFIAINDQMHLSQFFEAVE